MSNHEGRRWQLADRPPEEITKQPDAIDAPDAKPSTPTPCRTSPASSASGSSGVTGVSTPPELNSHRVEQTLFRQGGMVASLRDLFFKTG